MSKLLLLMLMMLPLRGQRVEIVATVAVLTVLVHGTVVADAHDAVFAGVCVSQLMFTTAPCAHDGVFSSVLLLLMLMMLLVEGLVRAKCCG